MIRKWRNVPTRVDGILFGSRFEAKVYTLLKVYDKRVICHPKIPLMATTRMSGYFHPTGEFISGDNWRQPTWTPDFYSPKLNAYVEAKGALTETFKLKMRVLAASNVGVLESLIVVGKLPRQWEGLKIITVTEFQKFMKERHGLRS